jgi:2-polyprenyl-3-methyl-5-hydroxy-6-metoxy-1,4-benzoquinol methylase
MTTYSSNYHSQSVVSGGDLVEILDLGMHAYADTFISQTQLHLCEPVFPLKCYLDRKSGHIQLGYVSSADERYSLYTYSYTSGNSKFSRNHWDRFAEDIKNIFDLRGRTVVEIGSNDGYLLEKFQNESTTLLGVDPSSEICQLARDRGLTVIDDLYDAKTVDHIHKNYGGADLIISNNVLNHANDPVKFVGDIKNALTSDGRWVFEVPYWKDMVVSEKFDQIYHEHISYFTVKSLVHIMDLNGLCIESVKVVDYHGGSLHIVAKVGHTHCSDADAMIQEENSLGLFDVETYSRWQKNILAQRDQFMSRLFHIRMTEPDVPIIGVGAAAKANTLLNVYRIDASVLHCITDSSDFKQGKYTPLTRIPIRGDSEFARHKKCYALILSWNISSLLKDIILKINPNTEFIEL